ncbi:hypothetical protein [Mesorhizobium sp. M0040]|uniref:hypothetical protein n=1 Tax=Mesorhizobium sp. M0040 TaxID=2956855 RepID=UPI00333BED70
MFAYAWVIAKAKLIGIDRKIAELIELRGLIHHLVEHCHGDERPDCLIIDELAGQGMAQ